MNKVDQQYVSSASESSCNTSLPISKSASSTHINDTGRTSINVPITRLDSSVESPAYAYPGDAGLDLRSSCDLVIQPFERKLIPTGLAVAIPEGYAGFVLPRSGMALKHGLSMANTPGLIDSHYRGELKVIAINLDPHTPITIARGERIAQLVIMAVAHASLIEVDQLDETERGIGGFGSSGTH